jgi:hypothetical protein
MATTIMTSCDPVYLRDHAPALMVSSIMAGHDFHLHVVSPAPKDLLFMERLREQCLLIGQRVGYQPRVTMTSNGFLQSTLRNPIHDAERDRVYWACDRFFTAARMLEWYNTDQTRVFNSLVIVDTDCLVLHHFQEPESSIGLFFREPLKTTNEWESSGTLVAAGLVYVKNDSMGRNFLERVTSRINRGPVKWFLDQVAIADAAAKLDPSSMHHFDSTVLDWEFKERTTIWTGKGDRKFTNTQYLQKKAFFMEKLSYANL